MSVTWASGGRDNFRRSSTARGLPDYREWQHFMVLGDGVDIVVNFSLVGSATAPVGRVLLLVHEAGWGGDLEVISEDALEVRSGMIDARFGDSRLAFRDGAYEISVRLRSGISADLRLRPAGPPFVAHNLELGDGALRSWLVVPRAIADGEVRRAGRTTPVRSAPAYHDHNWGAWGGDLLWDWGFGLPTRADASRWSVVFGRLIDARRGAVLVQALFVWEHGVLRRLFRDAQIRVTTEGILRAGTSFKVPAVMGLLHPGQLVDVPRRLGVDAEDGGDRVALRYEPAAVAQVLLPRPEDLGTTEIDETTGALSLAGTVRGEAVDLHGRGAFEVVHARR